MSDERWKKFERRVAGAFGCERTPLSGGNSKQTRADVLHDNLFIECKSNFKHPMLSRTDIPLKRQFGLIWVWSQLVIWHMTAEPFVGLKAPPLGESRRQNDSLARLFERIMPLAIAEGKLPVLALGQTGRHGFWLCCKVTDLEQVCAAL